MNEFTMIMLTWCVGYACLVTQSCLTLCDPMDHSLPGSSVQGIFFNKEYWSRLPLPPPGDLPDPRIKPVSPVSPTLQADSLPTEPQGKPSKWGSTPHYVPFPKTCALPCST